MYTIINVRAHTCLCSFALTAFVSALETSISFGLHLHSFMHAFIHLPLYIIVPSLRRELE